MTELEIFATISNRQVKALMFHHEMADYFDFLSLRGFKRMHEYQYLKESVEMRGLHRYVINHVNRLIPEDKIASFNEIPSSWYNYTRKDVDASTKKSAVKDALQKYYDWEAETLALYEKAYSNMLELGKVAHLDKINCLICDVNKELKKACRLMLKYKAVDYDMICLVQDQDELHEKYKEKTKKLGVDIT